MPEYKRVAIKGLDLLCGHCGCGGFTPRRWQLSTPLTSSLSFDSLGATADVFVCARCGKLHWFLFRDGDASNCILTEVEEGYDPERHVMEVAAEPCLAPVAMEQAPVIAPVREPQASAQDPDLAELDEYYDVECLQCGQIIPAGRTICVRCGWTYKE